MKNKLVAGLMIAALAFVGCTQSKNEAPKSDVKVKADSLEYNVIQNVTKNVIVKTYQGLADSAKALHAQTLVIEQSPTQANLDQAQELWKQSRYYWESTESFLFGPVESLSIDPMIDTWPLSRADLTAIIGGNSPITADFIRSAGANIKGFHTIEFLLFGDGIHTNKKLIGALSVREIEYLKATTEILAEDTGRLAFAWTTRSNPDDELSPAFIQWISNPGSLNSPYPSEDAVIVELINGMIGIADEVANGKIADPLGASIAEVNLDAEESPYSWNSVSDFSDNIRSLKMIYSGHGTGPGVKDLLTKKDSALAAQVQDQIDDSIAKIQAISGPEGTPFGKSISDPIKRQRAIDAQSAVNKLFLTLDQDVLPLFQ